MKRVYKNKVKDELSQLSLPEDSEILKLANYVAEATENDLHLTVLDSNMVGASSFILFDFPKEWPEDPVQFLRDHWEEKTDDEIQESLAQLREIGLLDSNNQLTELGKIKYGIS